MTVRSNKQQRIQTRQSEKDNPEKTEGTVKKDNPEKLETLGGYTRQRKTKQTHNTICVGHNYMQTNTKNANKICTLLLQTGGKDKPNIVFIRK